MLGRLRRWRRIGNTKSALPLNVVGDVRLERHPAVIDEDIPVIYSFIAKDDEAAAERVLDAVSQTFALLVSQPDAGVVYRTRNTNLRGVKMIPVEGYRNFVVFYRTAADYVRVLYVVHGARNLVRFFADAPRE